ncbi:conserved hypothetical protein, partial [Ixodes scapularis]
MTLPIFSRREEVREMFYHAYRAYMDYAYPADELMPLSCKGRYRGTEPNRGDIDDALGNFSLTLVDTMDTLVLLGDIDEFERVVRLVVRDVTFDHDIVVSVFEANIRMVGGLLSGHILASYLQEHHGRLDWYRGDLLLMAKELGYRLLPAFNTSTGVPHPRINLRLGLKSPKLGQVSETCTACAGTMILEFAALSRLTGEPIFEEKARAAMDYLWQQRHRSSDLMGTVLNIHNGDWVRRDSGVGAGIDSYYEYCLKAYILLGDDLYLERFNKHYTAVMKYISNGPMLVDVHMHRPNTNSRNFMDALLAFWPGLQVLKGDIKPAIETHEMLYQVMQRHNFLPEAFTTDFQVHWGQHPLRPEFVESTYFLYKVSDWAWHLPELRVYTRSVYNALPVYHRQGVEPKINKHLESFSRLQQERLAQKTQLWVRSPPLGVREVCSGFTTPLWEFSFLGQSPRMMFFAPDEEFAQSCPNTHFLFPKTNFAHSVRQPLKDLVEGACPSRTPAARRLHASQFEASKKEHLNLVKKMGVFVTLMADGRIQLIHNAAQAESQEDAQEGLLFMQEMIELAKQQNHQEQHMRSVAFTLPTTKMRMVLQAGPAQFGKDLSKPANEVEGPLVLVDPKRGCGELRNGPDLAGKIAVMERGECMFVEKVGCLPTQRPLTLKAVRVPDNQAGTNARLSPAFAMSGDGTDDVQIPVVFLFTEDGEMLLNTFKDNPGLIVKL